MRVGDKVKYIYNFPSRKFNRETGKYGVQMEQLISDAIVLKVNGDKIRIRAFLRAGPSVRWVEKGALHGIEIN